MISKAPRDNEIVNEDFATIVNEEINYWELKETIKMMKCQTSDIKRNKLIEHGKGIGID